MVGYIVYTGTQSGVYTAEFNVSTATSFVYAVVPDQQHFFVVASYAEGMVVGPQSEEVVAGAAPGALLLSNPGDQVGTAGSPTELQLIGMDSFGRAPTFSAAGLPRGLNINSSTGLVSGTPAMADAYIVTVTASDGRSTTSQTFTWTIAPAPQLADVTPPVVTITLPAVSDQRVTKKPVLTIGGMASDDNGIAKVRWVNSRGGHGIATGTEVWLTGVELYAGQNDITITAIDDAGNRGKARITIYRAIP